MSDVDISPLNFLYLLRKLNDSTVSEIVARVSAVKGKKECEYDCAIARWFGAHGYEVRVLGGEVESPYGKHLLSYPVSWFIRRFDRGYYPELVSE